MNIDELRQIKDETQQVSRTYELFNEDARLNHSKSARVEFLTTVKQIEEYLKTGDRILDIGAGAGEYSLYFAKLGYEVSAVELAPNNIRSFQKKIAPDYPINLKQGNAMDLSYYDDESFDLVLLFGPLYHLHNEADRQMCISEAKRVCKKDGKIFFAFISNDMVILTEFGYNQNFFKGEDYNHDIFKLEDFPFVFFNINQCRKMLQSGKVNIVREIASDGLSELLADKIDKMDEYSYQQYLKFHFQSCTKPEMLGHSNHLLFIGTKQ